MNSYEITKLMVEGKEIDVENLKMFDNFEEYLNTMKTCMATANEAMKLDPTNLDTIEKALRVIDFTTRGYDNVMKMWYDAKSQIKRYMEQKNSEKTNNVEKVEPNPTN